MEELSLINADNEFSLPSLVLYLLEISTDQKDGCDSEKLNQCKKSKGVKNSSVEVLSFCGRMAQNDGGIEVYPR